jgi:hypothetical protein
MAADVAVPLSPEVEPDPDPATVTKYDGGRSVGKYDGGRSADTEKLQAARAKRTTTSIGRDEK